MAEGLTSKVRLTKLSNRILTFSIPCSMTINKFAQFLRIKCLRNSQLGVDRESFDHCTFLNKVLLFIAATSLFSRGYYLQWPSLILSTKIFKSTLNFPS